MAEQNIENAIKAIFLKTFPELTETTFDFSKKQEQFENWDSFSHMELVAAIEKDLNVTLDMDEVIAIQSPMDFVATIKAKKSS